MTQLTRLAAISIMIVSLSGVALAGETLGPPLPPPDCTTGCSEPAASAPEQPLQDSSIDIVTEATTRLAVWLQEAIF